MLRPADIDLNDPELYLNRELGLLEFQWRVLAMARDESVPLLERLRFLTITSTNLDEFFEIRVAGLKEQIALGLNTAAADGLRPRELLARVQSEARRIIVEQYRVLNDELLPALADEGVRVLKRDQWSTPQKRWVREHASRFVLPILTPIGLDPAHPFPRIQNKSLCFALALEGEDAFGRSSGIAIVQVPRSLPRVVPIPREIAEGPAEFVLLSSIVHDRVHELFPGMKVAGCWQFRITRNSELWVDEEEAENLLQALKGELSSRRFGDAVRLEVSATCPAETTAFLLDKVGLDESDLYLVNGPVNLHRLARVYHEVDRPRLKFRAFTPGLPRRLERGGNHFDALRRGDVLLHLPFQSFNPVVELLQQAAADPEVLAIKQTLYRTGPSSPIVGALIDAARAGKEVTAVIELLARFDEAENIHLATRLEEAGAIVAYGVVGHKTHAKLTMIVRREGRRLRRYVHLGTGNYHPQTARAYTDFGLLSCDPVLGEDVHRIFLQLTGMGKQRRLKRILLAPFTFAARLIELINAEAENAERGRASGICAKMNGLTDPDVIRALYQASQAGVPIDLIVRGVCCLRPGVPGVSETIRVRSVVGRFLEHSRIYHFTAGGRGLTYLASADWMERNLHRRVETCFPILDERLQERVMGEGLEPYLADNCQAWELTRDGVYTRLEPAEDEDRSSAQETLLGRLAE